MHATCHEEQQLNIFGRCDDVRMFVSQPLFPNECSDTTVSIRYRDYRSPCLQWQPAYSDTLGMSQMIGLLLIYLWLQWQSGYSDTFPMFRVCHCKRGPLYLETRSRQSRYLIFVTSIVLSGYQIKDYKVVTIIPYLSQGGSHNIWYLLYLYTGPSTQTPPSPLTSTEIAVPLTQYWQQNLS